MKHRAPFRPFLLALCSLGLAVLLGSQAPEAPLKIACLGDSITFGSGMQHRERNNYPAQLDRMLGQKAVVANFGVSGRTLLKQGDLPIWEENQFRVAKAFRPDIVIIKLGSNDAKPRNWGPHGDEFVEDYLTLIETFRQLPSEPEVHLCKVLPAARDRWGITQKAISTEVNPAIEKVANKADAPLIDLHTPFQGHDEWFHDGIHPNAKGAEVMAKTIGKHLRQHSQRFRKTAGSSR